MVQKAAVVPFSIRQRPIGPLWHAARTFGQCIHTRSENIPENIHNNLGGAYVLVFRFRLLCNSSLDDLLSYSQSHAVTLTFWHPSSPDLVQQLLQGLMQYYLTA